MRDGLSVSIEGGTLIIRCPVGVLVTATVLCDLISTYDERKKGWLTVDITNPHVWSDEVARILRREEEDGTTLVTRMFDRAFFDAWEDGADGIEVETIRDEAAKRRE